MVRKNVIEKGVMWLTAAVIGALGVRTAYRVGLLEELQIETEKDIRKILKTISANKKQTDASITKLVKVARKQQESQALVEKGSIPNKTPHEEAMLSFEQLGSLSPELLGKCASGIEPRQVINLPISGKVFDPIVAKQYFDEHRNEKDAFVMAIVHATYNFDDGSRDSVNDAKENRRTGKHISRITEHDYTAEALVRESDSLSI